MATLFNNWLLKEVVNKMIKILKLLLNTCSIYIIISLKPKSMHDHSRGKGGLLKSLRGQTTN